MVIYQKNVSEEYGVFLFRECLEDNLKLFDQSNKMLFTKEVKEFASL